MQKPFRGMYSESTTGLKIDFLERDIDTFAGWAGDLYKWEGVAKHIEF